MAVTVVIDTPPELSRILEGMSRAQTVELTQAAGKTLAPQMTRWLVDTSQVAAGSGPFARGWLATPSENGLSIRNSFGKARFIEFATRPHLIRPKRAKALSWMPGRGPFSAVMVKASTRAASGAVFAMVVHHPGTGGKHIFPLVLKVHDDDIFKVLTDSATAILTGE
jgi:hypothetical protein